MADKLYLTFSRGHDYVQIGKTKWATMNIGAKSITDFGLYFSWGEIKGYNDDNKPLDNKVFSWAHYKFGLYHNLAKYNDGLGPLTLQPQDDAARVNWRGAWRIPTDEEFDSLILNTTQTWIENYQNSGVNGLLVIDKANGNALFFPAAGYGYAKSFNMSQNICGFYWSSRLKIGRDYTNSYNLFFTYDMEPQASCVSNARYLGFSIRAVLDD